MQPLGKIYEFYLKYEFWDFRRKLHDYDGIPCNDEKGYSKDFCYSREIERELLENFGCTSPYGLHKTRICNNATIGEKVMQTYQDAIHTDNYKSCFNPCSYFSISPFTPIVRSSLSNKLAYVNLYFDKDELVKIYESYYIYSELSLIAEVGGYVGLFLGISVNQVTNLMDFILTKLQQLCQRSKS